MRDYIRARITCSDLWWLAAALCLPTLVANIVVLMAAVAGAYPFMLALGLRVSQVTFAVIGAPVVVRQLFDVDSSQRRRVWLLRLASVLVLLALYEALGGLWTYALFVVVFFAGAFARPHSLSGPAGRGNLTAVQRQAMFSALAIFIALPFIGIGWELVAHERASDQGDPFSAINDLCAFFGWVGIYAGVGVILLSAWCFVRVLRRQRMSAAHESDSVEGEDADPD